MTHSKDVFPPRDTLGPSDTRLEALSAWLDGEASAFEQRRLVEMLTEPDASLRQHCERYTRAQALMQSQANPSDLRLVDLSSRISAALAAEPTYRPETPSPAPQKAAEATLASPVVEPNQPRSRSWQRLVMQGALAASVALVAIVGLDQTKPNTVAPSLAVAPAVDPVQTAPAGFSLPTPLARNVSLSLSTPSASTYPEQADVYVNQEMIDAEVQQLLLHHAEMTAEQGPFGLLPLARAASMKAQ
jgi:sigma-E factor negative regulatory protein RseA